ncbi:MAG: MBL fold metallo-hydrolase [Candidatus Binataceae bacterium]
MRRIARIAVPILAMVIVAATVAAVLLQGSPSIPDRSDYQLDLATLRQLADQSAGARPAKLNAAIVAEAKVPALFFLGGLRFDQLPIVFPAYQVVYADAVVIIDAPPGAGFFAAQFPGGFNEAQYQAVQQSLTRASAIVITHEHADHLGGIAESPQLESFAEHLKLTREQRDDRKWLDAAGFPEGVRAKLRPIDFDHYYALAPGVVLVKAPGHTPGSQLVYVRLEDNSEYLIIGDVAWHMKQVSTPHCRSRLAQLLMGENAAQVTAELRTLHDFASAHPSVHFVVSHDSKQLADYQNAGLIGRGFSASPERSGP